MAVSASSTAWAQVGEDSDFKVLVWSLLTVLNKLTSEFLRIRPKTETPEAKRSMTLNTLQVTPPPRPRNSRYSI